MKRLTKLSTITAILGILVAAPALAVGLDNDKWAAWRNLMPPPPNSFHVVGSVLVTNLGQVASLAPASPQGINPAILILELKIEQQPGMWPQVVLPREVRYDVTNYTANPPHSKVTIRSGDAELTIDVSEVN